MLNTLQTTPATITSIKPVTPAPPLNLAAYGFELIEDDSPTESIKVAMGLRTKGELSITNLKLVTEELFKLKFGEQWVYGDMINLFNHHPEVLEQISPMTGKAVKTLRNWATTAYTYPHIYFSSAQPKVIDTLLSEGKYLFSGQHIGTYRHQGLEFTHMTACNALNTGDMLDIRALSLVKALADGMTVSEMSTFKDNRLREYAEGGHKSIQEYLAKESQKRYTVGKEFTKAVTSFSFDVPRGATYTEVLALLRSHARDIASHAQESNLAVSSKVVK